MSVVIERSRPRRPVRLVRPRRVAVLRRSATLLGEPSPAPAPRSDTATTALARVSLAALVGLGRARLAGTDRPAPVGEPTRPGARGVRPRVVPSATDAGSPARLRLALQHADAALRARDPVRAGARQR